MSHDRVTACQNGVTEVSHGVTAVEVTVVDLAPLARVALAQSEQTRSWLQLRGHLELVVVFVVLSFYLQDVSKSS